MTYDEILSHLQVKKRYQDKAQCQCPAHDDRHASLTVTKGRDSVDRKSTRLNSSH